MNKPSLKYCGIHSFADLKVTARSKADYLGFIFAESKRAVNPADVKSWCGQIATAGKSLSAFSSMRMLTALLRLPKLYHWM